MSNEKLFRLVAIMLLVIGGAIIAFLSVKYVLPIALPFLIGWGIALIVRPLGRKVEASLRMSRRLATPLIAIILLVVLLALTVGLGFAIASQGVELLTELAESGKLDEIISKLLNPFEGRFDGEYSAELEEYLASTVENLVSGLLSGLASVLGGVVSAVPKILFFLLVTLISTVYFCQDIDKINAFVVGVLPDRAREYIKKFKKNSLSVVLKYSRSYFIIMMITFAIMLIGFSVLQVKYALIFSLILATLDVLPLIGVGTVLVPYSVISFVTGDVRLGIGLFLLFLINEIIRQLAEPKILGKNLGIHPLFTVVLLYAGYSLFGFMGLLLLPIFAVVINCFLEKAKSSEIEE